jgi:DNA-binding MarR family transcriptional regulator
LHVNPDPDRAARLAALERAMRQLTGQSILLSQSVAALAGLNSTDLECLDVIAARGNATAGDLAAATGLSTGAITTVIDRLEAAGHVRREPDPDDRRKVRLRVLPEAAARIGALYAPLRAEMLALWSQYADAELALVTDFMDRSHEAAARQLADLHSRARPGTRRGKRRS